MRTIVMGFGSEGRRSSEKVGEGWVFSWRYLGDVSVILGESGR